MQSTLASTSFVHDLGVFCVGKIAPRAQKISAKSKKIPTIWPGPGGTVCSTSLVVPENLRFLKPGPSFSALMLFLIALGIAFVQCDLDGWVIESKQYTESLRKALEISGSTNWSLIWCGANGTRCAARPNASVVAVIGRADAIELDSLPSLRLVQGASNYYTNLDEVPANAAVARFNPFYNDIPGWYGAGVIAEWMIAAAMQRLYTLPHRSRKFRQCAFKSDTPYLCPAASTAASHKTFASQTVGIVGYGHIGKAVATMAAGLGATVVASDGKAVPGADPPPPLKWFSPSNDRVFCSADIIFLTVAGTAGEIINSTSLNLMRDEAHLIPTAHETINWDDLLSALVRRPNLFATIDNWPLGCWGWPQASCGHPGSSSWPASEDFAKLPNVLMTGDMAMRDAEFWSRSAQVVASNLIALSAGRPLQYVVRNATHNGEISAGNFLV